MLTAPVLVAKWAFIIVTSVSPYQVGPFDNQDTCEKARAAIALHLFAGREAIATSKCFEVSANAIHQP